MIFPGLTEASQEAGKFLGARRAPRNYFVFPYGDFEANQGPKTPLGALTLDTRFVLWLFRG